MRKKYFVVCWIKWANEIRISVTDSMINGTSAVFFVDRRTADVYYPEIIDNTFYGNFEKKGCQPKLLVRLKEIWETYGNGEIVKVVEDQEGLPQPITNFTRKNFGKFLADKNIKIKDINRYLTYAYKIGIDPLPTLRNLLTKAGFANVQIKKLTWTNEMDKIRLLPKKGNKPDLICWVKMNKNQQAEKAWIQI